MAVNQKKIKDRKVVFTSSTEKFLAKYYAPELLSKQGKLAIISIWTVMAIVSTYALTQV